VLHAQRAWYHPANPERFAANLSKKAQNEIKPDFSDVPIHSLAVDNHPG
jgi:hypothetical protein